MPRVRLAVAAAALVALAGLLIPYGPRFTSLTSDAVVSAAVQLGLIALFVWALSPFSSLGNRLLGVFVAAAVLSALLTWLGAVPLANVAKVVTAAALGLWIAENLEKVTWIALVAVVSATVDIVSVYAGPTKVILERGEAVVGYFTVGLAMTGYGFNQAYTAVGLSDLVFFVLYVRAAQRFDLRPRLSLVVMTASFVVSIAAAFRWGALPALPLLSVAFLATNADLLLRALRGERQADPG
jgi:hypothetical protein